MVGRTTALCCGLGLLLGLAACGQEDARGVREARAAEAAGAELAAAADGLQAEVTLCRKVGRRSGRRIGAGHRFVMTERSYVRALVDFAGVAPRRTNAVHLVWIRPDGRELFRRYAEVSVTPADEGYAARIGWREAEDLVRVEHEEQQNPGPGFTLDSRLNISAARERQPGTYRFRVYWNRELLLEEAFEVVSS